MMHKWELLVYRGTKPRAGWKGEEDEEPTTAQTEHAEVSSDLDESCFDEEKEGA